MQHLEADLTKIYRAALRAVDPYTSTLDKISLRHDTLRICEHSFSLENYRRIFLVGAGKASAEMSRAVLDVLGERLHAALIIVRDRPDEASARATILEAGHPEPDERSLRATQTMLDLLDREVTADDLVLFLLSGGASALLCSPAESIRLADKQATTRLLLHCGASIQEINTVRKHLSRVKGGRLLNHIHGAQLVTLLVSDVVGDDLSTIGSGPTAPDPTTFRDCLEVLHRHDIEAEVPTRVLNYLKHEGHSQGETLKQDDPRFKHVEYCLLATNRQALQAAEKEAHRLGYHPLILSSFIEGESANLARFYVSLVREVLASGHPVSPPCCLISGGETTVQVRGDGRGGRNQEFALRCLYETLDWGDQPVLFASVASDGSDGPTEAAGALVSAGTRRRTRARQLDVRDYLERNDSYNFFRQVDDLILTGPTGTNVMDFHFVLVGQQ